MNKANPAFLFGLVLYSYIALRITNTQDDNTYRKYTNDSIVYKRWHAMSVSDTCKEVSDHLYSIFKGNQEKDCAELSDFFGNGNLTEECTDKEYHMMKDAVCAPSAESTEGNSQTTRSMEDTTPKETDSYITSTVLIKLSKECKNAAKKMPKLKPTDDQTKDCEVISAETAKKRVLDEGCTESDYLVLKDAVCGGITVWVPWVLIIVCLLVGIVNP